MTRISQRTVKWRSKQNYPSRRTACLQLTEDVDQRRPTKEEFAPISSVCVLLSLKRFTRLPTNGDSSDAFMTVLSLSKYKLSFRSHFKAAKIQLAKYPQTNVTKNPIAEYHI
uniref:Uncharacterized protein n=1 Tax=Megaselia scalaris TaxID=36166 RepID=T1GDD4_MEGSC